MTNSVHMTVRDALIAALQAAPALAGGRIVGNRRRPMAAEHATQIYVYLEESLGTRETIGTTDWRTRIRVECLARASAGVSAEDAADALGVGVFARVMADTTLGGKAIDTTPQAMAWTEDEADTPLAACQQIFSVWHTTADESISA
ncbi:MAG: hypothetical protein Q8R67_05140 [Rhodoferax sp.]|nr:hypothetical protein [Rhodoferax sp.]MDP3651051.1 hypothetical protein [Rhodoferax sp.]